MNKYRTLYKWMILPMVVMQLGIFRDYWGDFSDNAWSVHIHYWTGTVWYLYLIIQPYFVTHGQIARHRTNGIIGMFLAGGVCLTALSMLNRDIVSSQEALKTPDRFGPFQPWFFLWCGCSRNYNDDRLRICSNKKHHSQKRNRKSFMVVDINSIYYYDAGSCPWNTKCICWHAYWKMAKHKYHAFHLLYAGANHRNATPWCMEIWKTQTSCHISRRGS